MVVGDLCVYVVCVEYFWYVVGKFVYVFVDVGG